MTNQCKRLLEYLEVHKQINPLEAWTRLGIYRLSDTVYKLRNLGYDIETQQQATINKFRESVKFAKYVYKGLK